MRLKKHILTIITAAVLGLTFGWGFGGHEAKAQDTKKRAPETKSDEEYKAAKAYQDAAPKDKPAALDNWKKGFPQSEFADQWPEMYLFAYNDLKDARKTFDQAAEILKTRPNYFYSLQFILSNATQLNPLQPADLDIIERVSKHILDEPNAVFAADNKPAAVKDEQWAAFKQPFTVVAQRTYAWVFIQRKDNPKAEVEITKYLQMDGTQAQFSYFLAQALLAQNKTSPEKAAPTLFHFARAAAYDGQNSFPAPQRKTVLDYVTNAYKNYHCSDDGLPQLLALAKANTFPPAGFNIKNCADIQRELSEKQAADDAANPVFAFWRDFIKTPLLKDDGQNYFEMSLKDAAIPSGANNLMKLKGKLISQTPATKPKQLVIGVEKGDVADTTLNFEEALPGNMDPGSVIEFEGVVKAFTKEPFMLTLEVTKEQLGDSWTGTNPKGTPNKGKGPAKGTGKAK